MRVEAAEAIVDLLACPACGGAVHADDARLACAACGAFERVDGLPVLVDFTASFLDRDATLASGGASIVGRHGWRRLVSRLADGANRVTPGFARAMLDELERSPAPRPVLLIVGGGVIGSGAEALYRSSVVRAVSFDVYAAPLLSFVADGHAMPLRDASVDAVWIQSVLEHVSDPARVVAEIRRVLRPGGPIFVDTSFLWPVNEGAYDYNRWSLSGLRWLLRDFTVIAAGSSSGPGTMSLLALRYLAQALTRSTKLGQLLTLPFVWLRLLDRWCAPRRGLDAAAGLFVYGRRAEAPIALAELIAFYDAQPALHAAAKRYRA